jgi:hypothetical protein
MIAYFTVFINNQCAWTNKKKSKNINEHAHFSSIQFDNLARDNLYEHMFIAILELYWNTKSPRRSSKAF